MYYFYLLLRDNGIEVSQINFQNTLIFVMLGVGIGYWSMRSMMKKLMDLVKLNQQTLKAVLGPEKIRELAQEKNEIAVLARSFKEITSRLEDNIKNLELAKRTLHSVLAKVGQGISSMQNIDTFLDLIVETAVDAFSGKVGVLLLMDDDKKMRVKTAYGIKLKDLALNIEHEPFKQVFETKKPFKVNKDQAAHFLSEEKNMFPLPLLCAPLVLHKEVIGILSVGGKESGRYEADEINLISNLALQTAVAIENSRLSEDVEKTYFETISALALAVDAKDKYSRGHLDRVAKYVVQIGEALKLSRQEITLLRDAARLHDVGKIGVPDEILLKPAPLTTAEMDIMKKHPEVGESIIKPIRSLRVLCDIIRHHHEKLNGNGYPDGLKGSEISHLVRITTVADIFDALTTDRPYRSRFSVEEAFKELRKMKEEVDQNIVEIFIKTLK